MAYKKISPPDTSRTDEIIDHLKVAIDSFHYEYAKAAAGNKSAAIRARNTASSIAKGLKMFRKESLEFWK